MGAALGEVEAFAGRLTGKNLATKRKGARVDWTAGANGNMNKFSRAQGLTCEKGGKTTCTYMAKSLKMTCYMAKSKTIWKESEKRDENDSVCGVGEKFVQLHVC